MRRRRCPKCGGSGNAGLLASYRCDACDARGWFDITDLMEYEAYRRTCDTLGVPVEIAGPDNTPLPEPNDVDDS